ncbi:MAG: hypothetical protein QM644_08315, partial [Mobilitalea sp.]
VQEAVVTGNNSEVNTEGTTVKVAQGTTNVTVNGTVVKEEDKVVIPTPTPLPTPTTRPGTTPTITPKPSVTPTVTIAPTPTTIPTTPPIYVPPVTQAPVPSPTVKPTPTVTPTPTAIPTPTSTPTPTVTPTPTEAPDPVPSEAEKLVAYNEVLADIEDSVNAYMENKASELLPATKTDWIALMNLLMEFDELKEEYQTVALDDAYLYAYADYAFGIIENGSGYATEIQPYYISKRAGTATYTQAVAAANDFVKMIGRVNVDTSLLSGKIKTLIVSFALDSNDFYEAMLAIIEGEENYYSEFTLEDAPYFQNKLNQLFLEDEELVECSDLDRLTTRQAISCFNKFFFMFDEEYSIQYLSEEYEELLEEVIAALPVITKINSHIVDGKDWYDNADYDYEAYVANGGLAALQTVLQELFDAIGSQLIAAEDYEVKSENIPAIVDDLVWKSTCYNVNEDGYYEVFYRYLHEKGNFTNEYEEKEAIVASVNSIVWGIFYSQNWSVSYIATYQNAADAVITAAKADNKEGTFLAIKELYRLKLSENNGNNPEWSEFPAQPVETDGITPAIDKDYYIDLIQNALEDENSRLYAYDTDPNSRSLDHAMYELRDFVYESHTSQLEIIQEYQSLVEEVLDKLPEGTNHYWTDEYGVTHFDSVEYDTDFDSSELLTTLRSLLEQVDISEILNQDLPDYEISDEYMASILQTLMHRSHCDEVNPDGWIEPLYYYAAHIDELTGAARINAIREALHTIVWGIYDAQREAERLIVLNDRMEMVESATRAYLEDELSSEKREATRAAWVALFNQLQEYEELKEEYQAVAISEDYLYDYAEYTLIILEKGSGYATEIKPYYDSKQVGEENYWQAVNAANDFFKMISRVNTETAELNELILPIYAALDQSSSEFYTAVIQLFDEPETEYPLFTEEQAEYFQERLQQRISAETYYNELSDLVKLTFIQSLDSYFFLTDVFHQEYELYFLSAAYEPLITAVLDALPEWEAHYAEDDPSRLEWVEYDENVSTAALFSALRDIFEQVNTSNIIGVDMSTYEITEDNIGHILDRLVWEVSCDTIYEDGSGHPLYYYRTNPDLGGILKAQAIIEAINSIVLTVYDSQNWSSWCLDRYQDTVNHIIAVATDTDVNITELYSSILELYQLKLTEEDENSVTDWLNHPQPNNGSEPAIDVVYFSQRVKNWLEDENSQLSKYLARPNSFYLNRVIYDLRDLVDESQLNNIGFVSNLYDAFYVISDETNITVPGTTISISNTGLKNLVQNLIDGQKFLGEDESRWGYMYYSEERFADYVTEIAGYINDPTVQDWDPPAQFGLYLYGQGNGTYDHTEVVYRAAGELMWAVSEVNLRLDTEE